MSVIEQRYNRHGFSGLRGFTRSLNRHSEPSLNRRIGIRRSSRMTRSIGVSGSTIEAARNITLAESGGHPFDREFENSERRCPFCGGMPQVSFLKIKEATSESGNRDLVCATCTINWSFRRVACAYCGEERPTRLGYFHTPEYDHIRIEACDTCKRYIKGVDLTRLGFAVPLVDEVAAAALDVWSHEHGYTKIELNLAGL